MNNSPSNSGHSFIIHWAMRMIVDSESVVSVAQSDVYLQFTSVMAMNEGMSIPFTNISKSNNLQVTSVNLQFASPLMQALPHTKMCGKVGKSEAGMLGLIWVKGSAKIGGGLAQKRSKVNCRFPDAPPIPDSDC